MYVHVCASHWCCVAPDLVVEAGVDAGHASKDSGAEGLDVAGEQLHVALVETNRGAAAHAKHLQHCLKDVRKRQIAATTEIRGIEEGERERDTGK